MWFENNVTILYETLSATASETKFKMIQITISRIFYIHYIASATS